jgi:hypothetical protein
MLVNLAPIISNPFGTIDKLLEEIEKKNDWFLTRQQSKELNRVRNVLAIVEFLVY